MCREDDSSFGWDAGKTLTVQAVTKAVVRQQAKLQPVLRPPIAISLNCANLAGGAQVRSNGNC